MAEEVPEEISPPRLTAEDVEGGIALAREERETVISLAERVPALSSLMGGLREKFPENYGEVFSSLGGCSLPPNFGGHDGEEQASVPS